MDKINWFESTSRSLKSAFPEHRKACDRLTQRLSSLLLERLPREMSSHMTELLPEETRVRFPGAQADASRDEDRSVGYAEFVQRASLVGSRIPDETCRRIADAFLWAVALDLPSELKTQMTEILPSELRSRMSLSTAHSPSTRVA